MLLAAVDEYQYYKRQGAREVKTSTFKWLEILQSAFRKTHEIDEDMTVMTWGVDDELSKILGPRNELMLLQSRTEDESPAM